jgi:hypothetical protein
MVHQLPVVAVAFSPDGKTLLTGCSDDVGTAGEARLWDTASGQSLAPPISFPRGVTAIAFRPDGKAVAIACGTGKPRFDGGEVFVRTLPAQASDEVERLRLQFQVWTGTELSDSAVYRPLTPQAWLLRHGMLRGSSGDRIRPTEAPAPPAAAVPQGPAVSR